MATKKELEEQLAEAQEELQQMKSMMGNLKVKKPSSHYKEKKFAKYNGQGDIAEWSTEILQYVNDRFDKEVVKIDFIVDHLEGKAKREIKYRLLDVSTDARNVCDMLIDTFGDKDKAIKLQQTFYSRVQQEGETTEQYAYALTDLIVKMIHVGVKQAYTTDQILKERFADGVSDLSLRRELSRLNIEAPGLKFHELRKRALLWEDSDRKDDKDKDDKVKASSEEMKAPNMLQLFKDQQKQLEQMQKLVQSMVSGSTTLVRTTSQSQLDPKVPPQASFNPASDKKPRIICRYCKEPNHIVRDCILVKQKERLKQQQSRVSHQEISTEVSENEQAPM